MEEYSEYKRQFIQLSRAWYAEANLRDVDYLDKITVGFYHPDGGTSGEFEISFEKLGGKIVPKLIAFDDSWGALLGFADLVEEMAEIDNQNVSAEKFCEILEKLDIEDNTPEKYQH